MNALIRELAEQAGIVFWEISGDVDWRQANREHLEEFAELIVRECINRIEQNRSSGENTDSWTITRDMAFHQMKRDLKEHFGVE